MAPGHSILVLITALYSISYVSGEVIFIYTSWEFEQCVCNNTYSHPTISLVLNSSVMYNITTDGFCFMNTVDITIRSSTNSPAVISCVHDDHIPVPTLGLAFINSSVTLQGVIFHNCGRDLNKLPDNIINMFNSSFLYYNSTHAAALLFIHSRVHMNEVVLRSSYGFAVIGINLVDSLLQNVNVSYSNASATVYNYYNETIGCGIMLHFLSYPQTEELKFYTVSVKNSSFFRNANSQNRSCANKMNLQSDPEMVLSAAALTILYTQHNYQANVYVDNSTFEFNLGTTGGAVLILHYKSYNGSFVNINNTVFKYNYLLDLHQCYGADVSFTFLGSSGIQTSNNMSLPLIIENTTFQDNFIHSLTEKNFITGALYIGVKKTDSVKMTMLFKSVKCLNNLATHTGVCMFAEMLGLYQYGNVSVILESIDASYNSLVTLSSIASSVGIFTFHGINCYINGTKERPSTFSNNFGTVIDATDANIYLSGDVLFDGNKGTSGAAIKMKYDSRLHFMNGLTANFTKNQAVLGGAIYADIINRKAYCAFHIQTKISRDIQVFFNNNSATEAGNDIYAFPIYHCQFNNNASNSYTPNQAMEFYKKGFHFLHHPENSFWSFSTKPTKLLLNNTMTSNGDIYTYPGQMVSLNLSALDELNRFVYTTVRVEIIPNKRDSSDHLWLSYEDKTQIVQESRDKTFTHINITVHTTIVHDRSLDGMLILSLPDYPESVYSEVHIYPCPLGFILDNVTTGGCVCSPALYAFAKDNSIPMTCSIQTQTFTRSAKTIPWAGVIEIENGNICFGISCSCPLGNCVANPTLNCFQSTGETELSVGHLTGHTFHRHNLCINNREGILCGKCKDGLSVVFGSHKCMHCSNQWLWTILIQVVLGPLVVYLLYALKLTLTTGTLNGIIFYVEAAYGGLIDLLSVHSDGSAAVLAYGFLSGLNLKQGFPSCFYDGMNDLWKVGLSLVFPIYLLIIVVVLIVLSRYSTWLSNRISHSSVQVLVTVVHISFSNLLLTIVAVFTYSVIYTSDKHYRVWYWDGTLEYMGQPHHILVIISLVLTLPLILPYLFFLLFAKLLIKHSSMGSNYLRPVYEAIHAPYKEGKHHWFVARLLLLIIIYVLYALYKTVHGSMLCIIVAALLALFLIGQALFRPFKNKLINLLDSWLMFNLTLIYVSLSYNNRRKATVFNVVAVFLAFLTFLGILLYHILWVTGVLIKIRRGVIIGRKWISDHIIFRHGNGQSPNQLLQNATDSYYGSCDQYREPLLSAST